MKKNFFKFMAMLAFALPVAFMTSCDDDEKNPEEQEEEVVSPTDGHEFIQERWVHRDDNGNIDAFGCGVALFAAEPTVAFIGVDDMAEAKEHFLTRLVPDDAKRVENGNNITVTLTDTLGHEINKVYFKENGNAALASVTLEKNEGIEKYVTEFRYILKSLWPENSGSIHDDDDDNCPFTVGAIYNYGDYKYVCFAVPKYGENGVLFRDRDEKDGFYSCRQRVSEDECKNYPYRWAFRIVGRELTNTISGNMFWQKLAVCIGKSKVSDIKGRHYWTGESFDSSRTMYSYTLYDNQEHTTTPAYNFLESRVYRHKSHAFRLYYDNKGTLKIYDAASNSSEQKIEWFTRNTELEEKAGSVALN